jgi:tetratricopeptide (TPR) repeat protein
MNKWTLYGVLAVLVAGAIFWFADTRGQLADRNREIERIQEAGDPEGRLAEVIEDLQTLEAQKTFTGILVTFLGAGLLGIFFVFTVLPVLAHRATHAIYDSGEMVEKDVMREARSLFAQGDYLGAIEAFKQAAAADPLNRLPWVEIIKIQKDHLHDRPAAIQTLRELIEGREWEVNDAAYFMFRLAELYDEEEQRDAAVTIMKQVIEQFSSTRHAANAAHKLHDWGVPA